MEQFPFPSALHQSLSGGWPLNALRAPTIMTLTTSPSSSVTRERLYAHHSRIRLSQPSFGSVSILVRGISPRAAKSNRKTASASASVAARIVTASPLVQQCYHIVA